MNTKKTLVAVIAAMLVAASLSCFAKGNAVTQWTAKNDDGTTYLLTFYSDKTCEQIATYEDGHSEKYEGTYSGDTTKDGEISMVADDETFTADIFGDLMDVDGVGFVLTKVK